MWVSFPSFSSCAFFEQEGYLATPSPSFLDRALRDHWEVIRLHPLLCVSYPIHYFIFKGSLVDPRLRASNEINTPSKLARYLSGMGAD